MLFRKLFILVISSALLASCVTRRASNNVPYDAEVAALLRVGKRYMDNAQYDMASKVFHDASERAFNQLTTTSLYLYGIAEIYRGEYESALDQLELFTNRFPKSQYIEDAKYHKGLALLESDNYYEVKEGLDLLFELKDDASNDVSRAAVLAIKNFLFYEMELRDIERYYKTVSKENTLMILEALCYQMSVEGERETAVSYYEGYKSTTKDSSAFLEGLLHVKRFTQMNPSINKVALFLPFNLDFISASLLDEIPTRSRLALDFYEGFLEAVYEYEENNNKTILLKVYDTQEDTSDVAGQLEELEMIRPDIIVGGYNSHVVRQLSEWAEDRKVPYMIPINPYGTLVEGKEYSFLMNPSIEMHGRSMAEYAYQSLDLRKVAVWTNQKTVTDKMAQGFVEVFQGMGGDVEVMVVDSFFSEKAEEMIPEMVSDMKKEYFDGVYIPINSDVETANLILSLISKEEIELIAMGSPRWRSSSYNYIQRDLKETYQLHFTTSNFYYPSQPAYQTFYNSYLKKYYYIPSDRSLQGYNTGKYIFQLFEDYDYSMPFDDFIRNKELYEGIQLSFFFGGGQINEYVNIGKYNIGSITKENQMMDPFEDKSLYHKN